jgi:hypothetical protein
MWTEHSPHPGQAKNSICRSEREKLQEKVPWSFYLQRVRRGTSSRLRAMVQVGGVTRGVLTGTEGELTQRSQALHGGLLVRHPFLLF